MLLIKILKRRDASSVILAIIIAMAISQPLYTVTSRWSGILSGLEDGQYMMFTPPNSGWQEMYLQPVVWVLVQLAVLEVLCWLYVGVRMLGRKLVRK